MSLRPIPLLLSSWCVTRPLQRRKINNKLVRPTGHGCGFFSACAIPASASGAMISYPA